MMKTIKSLAAWTAGVVAVFLSISAGADPLLPLWEDGSRWTVKAVYPSPTAPDEWSEPVLWRYEVTGREVVNGDECYLVAVTAGDEGIDTGALLAFRSETVSLARATVTKVKRGKEIAVAYDFERVVPVATEQSPIPYDTPVFPLVPPSVTEHTIAKRVAEGMKASQILRQEVSRESGSVLAPQVEGRNVITVTVTGDDGEAVFVQYWEEGKPWPLYGWNRNMKYWLVEESPRND